MGKDYEIAEKRKILRVMNVVSNSITIYKVALLSKILIHRLKNVDVRMQSTIDFSHTTPNIHPNNFEILTGNMRV
jgi:hypothetical protein